MAGTPIEGRGTPLDPMMQILWKAGMRQPEVFELELSVARTRLDTGAQLLQAKVPRGVTVLEDTFPGPAGRIPIRIYTPTTSQKGPTKSLPVTLFFHFGGFVIGSCKVCDGFCGLIAERARTVVVSVEYRLAPENPFPAPVEDALAAYHWMIQNAGRFGGDPSRIAVAGDSAGGQLAAVICQEAKRQGWQLPRCQLLIYPWLVPHSNLASYSEFGEAYPLSAKSMRWFGEHYFRNDEARTHPWATPMNVKDLSGLPDTIIATAGYDPLRDEGEVYAAALESAGVPVDFHCYSHLTHCFTMMGGVIPEAHRACMEIADKLAKRLTWPESSSLLS
jgi:acetyl esterase